MVKCCVAYNCQEKFRKGGPSFHRFPTDSDVRKKWIVAIHRKCFQPSRYSRLCGKHFTDDCFYVSPKSGYKKLHQGSVPSIFDFPSHLQKKKTIRKPPRDRSFHTGSCDIPAAVTMELVSELKANTAGNSEESTNDFAATIKSVSQVSELQVSSNEPCLMSSRFEANTAGISEDSEKDFALSYCFEPKLSTGNIAPRFRRELYLGDFTFEDMETPAKAKKFWKIAQDIIKRKNLELRAAQRQRSRLQEKVQNLDRLVAHLQGKNLLNESTAL